jgi:hypothetical protein
MKINALAQVDEVMRINPTVGKRLKSLLTVQLKADSWMPQWRFSKALSQAWQEIADASMPEVAEVDPGVQRLAEACAVLWRSKRSKGYDFGEVVRWLYGGEACNPRASIRGARAAAQFLGLGMAREASQAPVRRAIMESGANVHLAELASLCLSLHDGEMSEEDFRQQAEPLIALARECAQRYGPPVPVGEEQELTAYVSRRNGEEVLVVAHLPKAGPTADGKRRLVARMQRYEREVESQLYRLSPA